MTYYKFLNGREAPHVPGYTYRLKQWKPPVEGALVACENGYHVLTGAHWLPEWAASHLYVAELRGDCIDAGDKLVARECRIDKHLGGWNERTARLFAADCAERVLPVFERKRPCDDRPRKAIEAARAYARGEIGVAAMDAARDAARAANAAAAYASAAASGAAARDAAYAAAGDAASAAARTAEREWQTQRLLAYANEAVIA